MAVAPGEPAERWRPTSGAVAGTVVVVAALVAGSRALSDNSFLTHLATGRLILEDGRVPTVDPYSFSAPDAPWVVQSWLASVVYAAAERLGGALGLRLVYVVLCGALGALVWRLTRPADGLLARLGLAALVFAVGTLLWSERPLLFGLVLFALALVAAETRLPATLLVVAGWVWVNTHGSFPLGLVVLVLLALGRRLDGDEPTLELHALRWMGLGMVLGVVNPLGPKLLLFPLDLLSRQSLLGDVVEWQSPGFRTLAERSFLVLLVVAIAALVRRPRWRAMLPMAVFTVAGLLALRNVALASLVLAATAAPGLAGLGTMSSASPVRHGRVAVAALAAMGALVLAGRLQADDYDLEPRYPIRALALLEQEGVDLGAAHLVTRDIVGNLMTAIDPDARAVFLDDRYDMYPDHVVEGYVTIHSGSPGWRAELDDAGSDLVVWERGRPLTQLLLADPEWRTVAIDDRWATFCRRGSGIAALGC